ncbi:hypothetical protein FB45DRAFT_426487 [Roridomyces roridus]|uniref:Protein kinase domain-containing protein n=1 Tax=Roridomyces roridus TaxID=1738132 RepID=A0AAD7C7J7_9AGAR|nr:hypothetical protein FB45DRAFT_426487 [Roridomyces roridus]
MRPYGVHNFIVTGECGCSVLEESKPKSPIGELCLARQQTSSSSNHFMRIDLPGGQSLVLGDTIVSRCGTWVSRATMHSDSDSGGRSVILKCIWPAPTSRKSEVEVIKEATEKATGEFLWVRDHLPCLLDEFHATPAQLGLSEYCDEEVEELHVVVFEELYPITDLTNSQDLGKAFYDIFRCYHWMYEIAGIMHRDISISNLMFRMKDGHVYGVLNDFDLAVHWAELDASTSQRRTGTQPFMARELLKPGDPPLHIYRFDLESLLYVMAYVIYCYHDGQEIDDPPYGFEPWVHESRTRELARMDKTVFIADRLPEHPTKNFGSLRPVVQGVHQLFQEYHHYVSSGEHMKEAFRKFERGGEPDFDMVEKAFQENLPKANAG